MQISINKLSSAGEKYLRISCAKCSRRSVIAIKRALEAYGDLPLPIALEKCTFDCIASNPSDPCKGVLAAHEVPPQPGL